ncbi:MAG: hypothetical protein ABIY40_02900 [Rhodanobacteraceae bacterium]|nr:hypothetical protein [Pseudomonadota bacterium]
MAAKKAAKKTTRKTTTKKSAKKSSGKKFIQGAVEKPGALHKQLGVPKGQKIPAKKLAKAAKAPGKLGARARLAQTLKKLGKKKKK